MKRIHGEEVDDVRTLASQLVVRWSCGCLPESINRAVVLPKEVAHTGRLENKRTAAINALLTAAGISESDPIREDYVEVFGKTWDAFLASLRETGKTDVFLKTVQSMVDILQRHGYDFNTSECYFHFPKVCVGRHFEQHHYPSNT